MQASVDEVCVCGEGQPPEQSRPWIVDFMQSDVDESWKERAACRNLAPHGHEAAETNDLFFPPKGKSQLAMKAQMLCMTCPVRQECKEYRIRTGSEYGIWGGELKKRDE